MPFADVEELLTERELALYIKRSRRQLQRDRAERRGIPFLQFETQIRYRLGDVRAYLAQHLVGSNAGQRTRHTAAAAAAVLRARQRGRLRTAHEPDRDTP
jgi:hypothetical protein